jgi:hypothetical protein
MAEGSSKAIALLLNGDAAKGGKGGVCSEHNACQTSDGTRDEEHSQNDFGWLKNGND